jgi:hypothetical protein
LVGVSFESIGKWCISQPINADIADLRSAPMQTFNCRLSHHQGVLPHYRNAVSIANLAVDQAERDIHRREVVSELAPPMPFKMS